MDKFTDILHYEILYNLSRISFDKQKLFLRLLQAEGGKRTVMLKQEYYKITPHCENIFQMSAGIIDYWMYPLRSK
jgi:hypothetical protein